MYKFAQQDHTSGAQYTVDHLNIFKSMLDELNNVNPVATFQTMMLVWDTGASFVLTPFKSDFVDNVECEIPIKDVTKFNKSIGTETKIHKFKNSKGDDVYLPHIPMSDISLFSTEAYHQMHSGNSSAYDDIFEMHLSGHEAFIQIDREG